MSISQEAPSLGLESLSVRRPTPEPTRKLGGIIRQGSTSSRSGKGTMKRRLSLTERFSRKPTRPQKEFVADVYRIRKQLELRKAQRRCIFRPGESKFLNYWDVIGAFMLTYTALFTPFEVAFLPLTDNIDVRFVLNRILDIYFSLDLIAQFFISIRPKNYMNTRGSSALGEFWEDGRSAIAMRYIGSGWFFFDLFTLAPSLVDIRGGALFGGTETTSDETDDDGQGFLGNASVLRTLRVLRFVRLLRVARVARIAQRWASRITLRYSTVILIRCVVYTLISAHWHTWMGQQYYAFCPHGLAKHLLASSLDQMRSADTGVEASSEAWWDAETETETCADLPWGTWYLAAFSWSTMVITGTGGTDFYPSALSEGETVIVTLMVLVGAMLWTHILSLFCDVATNSDPAGVLFRTTLDEMNAYLEAHGLPFPLRRRVREYLHAQRDCQARLVRLETSKAVAALSPSLQVEVVMEVQRQFFERVSFLRHAEGPCCVQISLAMRSGVFAPGELAPRNYLYSIERGLIVYRGRILSCGKVWGDDDVLLTDGLIGFARQDRARAMTYLEYRAVSREALHCILEHFPSTRARLRRLGIFVALGRRVLQLAEQERARRADSAASDLDDEPVSGRETYGLLDSMQSAVDKESALRRSHSLAVEMLEHGANGAALSGAGGPLSSGDNKELRRATTDRRLDRLDERTGQLGEQIGALTSIVERLAVRLEATPVGAPLAPPPLKEESALPPPPPAAPPPLTPEFPLLAPIARRASALPSTKLGAALPLTGRREHDAPPPPAGQPSDAQMPRRTPPPPTLEIAATVAQPGPPVSWSLDV